MAQARWNAEGGVTQKVEDMPDGARRAVEDYFHGTYRCDRAQMTRAFHPDAHIAGNLKGRYLDEAAPDFIDRLMASPSEEAGGHAFDKRILEARWTDDSAMVAAENVVHGLRFIDYMVLLKIDGVWSIRNKIYTTAG